MAQLAHFLEGDFNGLHASLLALLSGIVLLLCYMTRRLFSHNPPGLVWRTFMDDRGVPNAQNVALFHGLVVLTIGTLVPLFGGVVLPKYIWITWDVIVLGCLFGTTYISHKFYNAAGAQAAQPAPDFGLTAPAANPATSTTLAEGPKPE